MIIPDKAVEAARVAVVAYGRRNFKGIDVQPTQDALDMVTAALEAACPIIEAAVLHEQARTWGTTVDQYGRSIASHIHRDARVAEHGTDAT